MSVKTIIKVLIIVLMFPMNIFSCYIGKEHGYQSGWSQGYERGQFKLATDIKNTIGETVNDETDPQTYKYLKSIRSLRLYIVERNGIKTIAFYDDRKK